MSHRGSDDLICDASCDIEARNWSQRLSRLRMDWSGRGFEKSFPQLRQYVGMLDIEPRGFPAGAPKLRTGVGQLK